MPLLLIVQVPIMVAEKVDFPDLAPLICGAAIEGGKVAGNARRDLEKKSGRRVVSRQNFKEIPEAVARKKIAKKEAGE